MNEKKSWMEHLTTIDRRWIFLLVAIAVVVPIILGITMPPVGISPSSQAIYDHIDSLPPGSTILIACDFDPASEAELYPMTLALYRHCFDKELRVMSLTLWPNGAALIEQAFDEMRLEYPDIESGVDYVNFGFQVGSAMVIIAAGENIRTAFTTDYRGNATGNMPVLDGVEGLGDLDYMVDLAAGATIEIWIAYGSSRYYFDMGAGCTAVSATQYYPYLNTGQINGLLGGLKGAAEYEFLADHPARALAGMTAQSSVHALVVFLVVIANIFYFITKKGKR